MMQSRLVTFLFLGVLTGAASPARGEDYPAFSSAAGAPDLHRLTIRAGQVSTGERGSSDAGAVASMASEVFSVPTTGISVLALSASWCTPCRTHVASLSRLQGVLSSQCGRAGDTASPRVIEITDNSLLKAFRSPSSRNRASREAWGSSEVTHELVMVPEESDRDFMGLIGLSASGAGGPLNGAPGTMIVVDGRIVSITDGMSGLFAGDMDECPGISDADRRKVRDYNAQTSACFVLSQTRKSDGTNRVGANALGCTFECPVARPEITCNGL